MTIDRHADRPLYKQLADIIRAQIMSGQAEPGSLLQAEGTLAQEHGVGRDTAREALRLLRREGLLDVDTVGYRVRSPPTRQTVRLPAGVTVTARMPTDPERREHGIGEGVPVLVVGDRIYSADRYQLST